MAHPVESAEVLALMTRPSGDGLPRLATAERRDGQLLVKATTAEVAQARLFDDILRAEVAELEQLACRLAGSLYRRRELDTQVDRQLLQIYERIEEARRLLGALQRRFPHTRNERTPNEHEPSEVFRPTKV
jgi:hypothetical protein